MVPLRDARSRRRALRWLVDAGLVAADMAETGCAHHPDPTPTNEDVPAAAAADLGVLYRDRLRQVLVFGARVHGDATAEPDLNLLVVLSELDSAWAELRRMDDVLWRHTERTGVAIIALPVSRAEFGRPATPGVIRAKADAVRIA